MKLKKQFIVLLVSLAFYIPTQGFGKSGFSIGDSLKVLKVEDLPKSSFFLDKNSYEQVAIKMAAIEKRIPLNFNSKIWAFIDYFTKKDRDFTLRMIRLKNLYFPLFEKKLAKHGLPDELKYLAIIESGLYPLAISRMGAAGLWQFIPSTGRMYGLKINDYIDERLDPEKATEAACLFLKNLYRTFGDWELAISAYNCGPGNVRKARRRSGKKTFWKMYRYLPRETRGYLPQLVAMIYVLHHQEEFHLKEERLTFPTPLKSVRVSNQSIDLVKLAGQLQMCTDDIKKLNPEIKNLYLLKTQNQKIQIPENRYALFIQNKEKILQKSIFTSNSKHYEKSKKKIYYKVRKGDYLGKIARIFGTTVSQIKIWNQLSKNTIRIGQRIVIYRKFR